uniref:hypothetical protein n=1 Tax=Amycolatopsis sp. CA-290885 TaxID=3239925 RepID=UPI003F49513A
MSADLSAMIELALRTGWRLQPQVHGGIENALVRYVDPYTDVVTLPVLGRSTIVRIIGGPQRENWQHVGSEVWRHVVPVELALLWVGSNKNDDIDLVDWERGTAPERGSDWFASGDGA